MQHPARYLFLSLFPLLLLLLFPACTPKSATTQETADHVLQLTTQCLDGNRQACKKIEELGRQYRQGHPCQFTPWPQEVENKLQKLIPQIFSGDVATLDQWITEAKQNNYGDCRTRSSLATSLRFMKGLGLYLAKNYPASALEFKTALAELGPGNNLTGKIILASLPLYPAALIKSGNIEQAEKVLQTSFYQPFNNLTEQKKITLLHPFLNHAGELLQIPNPQRYSWATLALTTLVKGANRSATDPILAPFIDALKTLSPYTPVPDFILEY